MDFNVRIERWVDSFERVRGINKIGQRNVEGRKLLEFCDKKWLCLANM